MDEKKNTDYEKLAWKATEKKLLLETRVFDVTSVHSVAPDGVTEGEYIVMDAPEWVIVIPETDDENFLMVKQWRHGENNVSIEFPGGVLEKGEKSEDGAMRELKEETGCVPKTLIHLGTLNPNPALMSNHVHIFLAKDLEFTGVQNLDKDEFVDYMKIKKSEVIKNMGSSPYFHALMGTALGLYLARQN